MSATRVAAVDCGTNTVKLLVADLDPATGAEVELVREARMVRLGEGVDATGRIAEAALDRLFTALEEYAALLADHGVDRVRFCATSAARDASNAEVFAAGVQQRLGVTPEVVTGAEEAALSFAGATRGMRGRPTPVAVVDIGGGSTEVVLGDPADGVAAAHSLDIGSVRMTERHLHGDPPTAVEIAAARSDVDRQLDRLDEQGVRLADARTLVVVSGTGLTVAAAALELDRLDREAVDGARIPLSDVRAAVARLLGLTVAERRALPYMHPGRADVIGAGALILDRVCARTHVDELTTSVADILDGIAWSVA